jgi:hypothetical protein
VTEVWSYVDSSTIQITGDLTTKYFPNQILKITQGTIKYFRIIAVNLVSGNTRLTVSGAGTFAVANAPITAHYISEYSDLDSVPAGFPEQANAFAAIEKSPLLDTDRLHVWDSGAGYILKFISWANLKTAIKTFIAPLYDGGMEAQVGDGQSVIPTGVFARIRVPRAATLTGWEIVAAESGSIGISVSFATYANYPTLTALFTATVTNAQKGQATGRTDDLAAPGWLILNVTSAEAMTQATISLQITSK